MVCITPHLAIEAIAYVFIAMAGVFLSRGLARHGIRSRKFTQVGLAVLRFVGAAVIALVLAAVLESELAPKLVAVMF